jgi:hypothetical protein
MAGHEVDGMPGLVAYLKPSHARPDTPLLMVKRPSFPRGSTPPHLVPYVEAVRAVRARLKVERKEE